MESNCVNDSWLGSENRVPDVSTIYQPPYWRTKEVIQNVGSILPYTILRGTFRRISQLWDNAHTLNMENCLLYFIVYKSQFLDCIHRMVSDCIFYCVTMQTLYLMHNLKARKKLITPRKIAEPL